MKQPELGRRLKEARISKKMTQSEVVGTFITRNMLSQIESGKAMPSLETLQYLADVLGIPPQSLISTPISLPEPLTERSKDPFVILTSAKESFQRGDYRTVLEYQENYPDSLEDEFNALLSLACCGLAEELLSEPLSPAETAKVAAKAVTLAREAMERSTRGIYANELVHSRALLLFNRAVQSLSNTTS